MGADERDGLSVSTQEVSARPENLRTLFETGERYVGDLQAIAERISARRSATATALGNSPELPQALVAKSGSVGADDPMAELISEATYNNGFVREVHDALLTGTPAGPVSTVQSRMADAALARMWRSWPPPTPPTGPSWVGSWRSTASTCKPGSTGIRTPMWTIAGKRRPSWSRRV